jgi:hypothetical protein
MVPERAMRTFWLHPAELFVARIVTILILLDAVLIALRGSRVDFTAYGLLALIVAFMLGIGLAYRRSGRSETIGAMMACTGLFVAFTACLSLFNYLLTPNPHPLIDPWLQAADATLGYHWPDAIAWAARHTIFSEILRYAYIATLPQIALLFIVLGLAGRLDDLHSLLVTLAVSALVTILFWGLFPTAGPSAFDILPDDLARQVQPVLGPEYGAYMLDLVRNGAPHLNPSDLRGLVAFPSFHTVLALALAWHARHVRWLFYPYLATGLLVLPAVLVHGGHHLVDIPAGMAVFAFGIWCARAMLHPAAERIVLRVA